MIALALVALLGLGPQLNHCFYAWNEGVVADNDLSSFNLYLATTAGGPYTKIGSVSATSPGGNQAYGPTSNMCAGLSDGQKYAVVRAVDTAQNESASSNEFPFVLNATPPSAPTGLSVQ